MKNFSIFISCAYSIFTVANTYTLDQLPEDVFHLFMQHVALLKDTEAIFSVVAVNKNLFAKSEAWYLHENDPDIINQVLHKACNNKPWTVGFTLKNSHITSAMVGSAICERTSNKSQKLLSAQFPLALNDGPKEKLQIKNRGNIKRYILNGFIIKEIYDGYGRSMPPLIYFSGCRESITENAFYPYSIDDDWQEPHTFKLNLNVIEALLKQNANPLFEVKLTYGNKFYAIFNACTIAERDVSHRMPWTLQERMSLLGLLREYKRGYGELPYYID